MADFTVDSRVSASSGTVFKTLDEVTLLANVPNGSTIEVVEGSGPYPALRHLNDGSHNKSLTWLFNGCAIQNDIDVNSQGWLWTRSTNELYPDTYYLTNAAGTASPLTVQPKTCEIWAGSIWYWQAESRNLFTANTGDWYHHKWGWGDKDSLGFSTLYVQGVGDPTGDSQIKIYVPHSASLTYALMVQYSRLTNKFYDAVIRGSQVSLLGFGSAVELHRCQLRNADMECFSGLSTGTYTPSGTIFGQCEFLAGHNGLSISGTNAYGNISVYNSFFLRTHLMARTLAETPCTLTLRNNTSRDLLAGGICKDHATPVLVEDHNQFHLDPLSTHAGKSISWTYTGTRLWTTTDATDLPDSEATTATTGVDPLLVNPGIDNNLLPASPCIGAGVAISGITTDADGNPTPGPCGTSIGPHEYMSQIDGGYGMYALFDSTLPALTTESKFVLTRTVKSEGKQLTDGQINRCVKEDL